ncbi:MAG: hypothetical protein LBN27_13750 [Prevotellaceae bacterium]|jgi:hypothetical protein|nr:hypothetical protein [Prevotellaceae bacterium]
MNEIKVLGYSERGIFNSIVFYLRKHPEKISGFLSKLDIKDAFFDNEVLYTFLNEQSFSDFGDNDWTIIAEKGNEKRVIFIEGKVKTSQGKFSLETNYDKLKERKKFDGISSNVFVQLFYKFLLVKSIKGDTDNTNFYELDDIFKKNDRKGGLTDRKIGKNPIVEEAINKIKNAKLYYYVAVLPIPLSSNDFIRKFQDLKLPMETENIKCTYWGDIESYFDNAPEVKENFEYNKGQIYEL